MKHLFRTWAEGHIAFPRFTFTGLYLLFVGLGMVAMFYGLPTLGHAGYDVQQRVWAGLLIFTAAGATVGSVRPMFEILERWSVLGIVALLLGMVASTIFVVVNEGRGWALLAFSAIMAYFPVAQFIRLSYRATLRHPKVLP